MLIDQIEHHLKLNSAGGCLASEVSDYLCLTDNEIQKHLDKLVYAKRATIEVSMDCNLYFHKESDKVFPRVAKPFTEMKIQTPHPRLTELYSKDHHFVTMSASKVKASTDLIRFLEFNY